MCKVLGIARSEYYYSKNKRKNSYEDFASTKSTRAYDKELGKLASTTGNVTGVEEKYQQARYDITRVTFQNMAKYKGIGVNEMATENSFYAPYGDTKDRWGWFRTPEQAVAGIQGGTTTWDGELRLHRTRSLSVHATRWQLR